MDGGPSSFAKEECNERNMTSMDCTGQRISFMNVDIYVREMRNIAEVMKEWKRFV